MAMFIEIIDVFSRPVLDSRGNPTVEVEIETEFGIGRAAVPSGASTGSKEAVELRDKKKAWHGKGVNKAVANVNEKIMPELLGMNVTDQRGIDEMLIALDGTKNKGKLGANAILGVSMAASRAAAQALDIPLYRHLGGLNTIFLPVPSMNVINGGAHAGNNLDIQEHMVLPVGAKSFSEALRMSAEVYHQLGKILEKEFGPAGTNIGDEGGYAPPMVNLEKPFDLIWKAIEECGYQKEMALGMDAAASEFYEPKKKKYDLAGKMYASSKLVDIYEDLAKQYNIVSIEDPFHEDDWDGFINITKAIGDKVQIVGDDLLVTNTDMLKKSIQKNACNALLLKVNQIGTVTESMDASNMAFRNGYGVMVSHRSGETEDTFIADLTVALNTGQLKSGAPCRSDRTAKYNQLLRIEEDLGSVAKYAGKNFRRPV